MIMQCKQYTLYNFKDQIETTTKNAKNKFLQEQEISLISGI